MNPLAGKTTTTHALAGIVGFIVAVAQLPQSQSFVDGLLGQHGQIAMIVSGLATILALYHNPQAGS